MVTKARLTAQDLWRLGEGDIRRELVNGEVVEMAPVGGIHGQITGRIYRWLQEHVEVHQKVRDYLEAGARLVWIIAAQAKTVTVYRADGSAPLLRDQDHLEGEDTLPGLTIPLAEVFR